MKRGTCVLHVCGKDHGEFSHKFVRVRDTKGVYYYQGHVHVHVYVQIPSPLGVYKAFDSIKKAFIPGLIKPKRLSKKITTT